MTELPPVLRLEGFGVCFGRRVVLSDVHLALEGQAIDVLMGPVKTGKSTLMRSLAGFNDASALYRCWGRAELAGRPIAGDHRPALVQQHASILGARVVEALWSKVRQQGQSGSARTLEQARTCLQTYGLQAVIPHLGDSILTLPVEWQRAVNILAHALAEPTLLMIDEPTFGLDDAAAERLIDWLCRLGTRYRLWVSLHHQGQARHLADHIALLAGGRILAYQETADFFARPANAWVEQFVRSGSLAIASPDARPEDLSPDAQRPPPLPAAALAALASFAEAEDRAAQSPSPAIQAAPAVRPATTPPAAVPVARPEAAAAAGPTTAATPEMAAPAAERARTRKLPALSTWGVEAAARVGLEPVHGRPGPAGFTWILPQRLAGCPEPGVVASIDYDLDLLVRAGITCLITLTEKDLPQEPLARHGLKNLHLPIYDREAPSMAQTYMLVRRMQTLLEQGEVLAVHCKAGIGRTGSVLAAWLIREGGLSAETAITRLRSIKSTFVQTEVQERFLHDFEMDIMSRM